MFDKLVSAHPNQKSRIPVPRVQQGNGTSPGTSPGSSSSETTSSSTKASPTDPVAGASMLGALRGTTRVEGCRLSAAGRDISFNTYNMNCAHLSAENGKLPDQIQLRRQRAEAEARTIDNERAEIVKNTAQQKAAKQGLAGGNINGAIPQTPEKCAIYVRNLLHEGHGWPFYIPGPSKRLPLVYRKEGMRFGDVGIINLRGSFEFLFNICHPADDPINNQGVPTNFEQLQIHPKIQEHSEFNGESYICSSSIRNSSGLRFESSASEGAILAMPVGAISEDVTNVLPFKKYASTHAEHWYRYIKSWGRDVENGDVRLVTGYPKTSRWCIATFSDPTANEQPFHLEFNHVTETNMGKMYEWKHSGTAQVRTGPGAQEIEDLDPGHEGRHYQNQSLFGRTISATLKEDIWNELAEEFDEVEIDDDSMDDAPESSNQGSTGSRRADSSTTPSTSASRNSPGQSSLAMLNNISTDPTIRLVSGFHQEATLPYHPSNVINKMLLELRPDARVAITSDNDWISILQTDDLTPPSNEELCARIKASLVIRQDEDAVFLENPESSDARIMQKDHLLLCAASFADIKLKHPPNKKEYWIRILVDGKQVFQSQKRDPDSSASWKEKKSFSFVPTSTFEVYLVQKDRRHPTRGVILGRFTARPGEIIDFLDQNKAIHLEDMNGGTLSTTITINFSLETNAAQAIMGEIEKDLSRIGPSEIVDLAEKGVDLANQGSSVVNTFSTYFEPLGTALQVIVAIMDSIADAHPVLNVAWTVLSSVYKAVKAQGVLDGKFRDLSDTLKEMLLVARTTPDLLVVDGTENIIEEIGKAAVEVATLMSEYVKESSLAKRTIKYQISDSMKGRIDDCQNRCKSLQKRWRVQLGVAHDVEHSKGEVDHIESLEQSESRSQILEEREAVEDDSNALGRLAVMIEFQPKEDEVEVKSKEEKARAHFEELQDVLADREIEAALDMEEEADENEVKIERVQETVDQLEYENDRLKEEGEKTREEETAERERLEALRAALKDKISPLKGKLEQMTKIDIYAHRSRQEEPAQPVEELVSKLQDVRPMHSPQPAESPRKPFFPSALNKKAPFGIMARDTTTTAWSGSHMNAMHSLVAAERAVLLSLQKLSVDYTEVVDALRTWGQHEKDDLGGILAASATLLNHFSLALSQYEAHGHTMQRQLETMSMRGDSLDSLKQRRGSAHRKAEDTANQLSKMDPENKYFAMHTDALKRLRKDVRKMDADIKSEDAAFGDFKRTASEVWLNLKFRGLQDCCERGAIAGKFGKMAAFEMSEEGAQPGIPRRPYSPTKVNNLIAEADRHVNVVCNSLPSRESSNQERPNVRLNITRPLESPSQPSVSSAFMIRMRKMVAHVAQDTAMKPMHALIAAERAVSLSLQKLSVDHTKAAEALRIWGKHERDDLGGILTASTTLLNHFSLALSQYAAHGHTMQRQLETMSTRGDSLDTLKQRRDTAHRKAEDTANQLSKMDPENKYFAMHTDALKRLRKDVRKMDADIKAEDAAFGDFKRTATKVWLNLKFGGLQDCCERGAIAGKFGKFAAFEMSEETTQPGIPRRPYSPTNVDNLVAEADRRVNYLDCRNVWKIGRFEMSEETTQPGIPRIRPYSPTKVDNLVAKADRQVNYLSHFLDSTPVSMGLPSHSLRFENTNQERP